MRHDTVIWTGGRHRAGLPAVFLLTTLALLLALTPETAQAADTIFGSRSPLQRFITFITGIFAYMLVIVGVVMTVGGLILGSDMSGLSRRAPIVVVAGAVLILADVFVGGLFGAQGGYSVPPDLLERLERATLSGEIAP